MLDMDDVIARLARTVPGIEGTHRGETQFWGSDPPSRAETYTESFVSYIRSRLERHDRDAIGHACAVMEEMAASGDARTKTALRFDVLTPLAAAPETRGAAFREAMGSALRREWDALLDADDELDYMVRLLSPAERAAADHLITCNLEAARDGLAAREVPEPVCAICLIHPHVDELPAEGPEGTWTLTTASVETQAHREEQLASRPEDWLVSAWLGAEFASDLISLPQRRGGSMREAERALDVAADQNEMPHPDDAGHRANHLWTEWPVGWLFAEVCRRLYREPPEGLELTPDFVVFHQGWDFDPNPIDVLPEVAPEHVIGLLRAQGLFRPWSELLHEDP